MRRPDSGLHFFPSLLASAQLLDEGKLQRVDDLYKQFESAESASKL